MKIKSIIYFLISMFLMGSCTPQISESTSLPEATSQSETTRRPVKIKIYKTLVSFSLMEGMGISYRPFYLSDSFERQFDYLRSDNVGPISITLGDYIEITHTGEIFTQPIHPPISLQIPCS